MQVSGLNVVNNNNINHFHLNRSKLHLKYAGTAFIAKNFYRPDTSLSSILTESINSGTVSVNDHSTDTTTSHDKNTSEDDFKDPASQRRDIKFKNINNPILAYGNVNSIHNKQSDLFSIIDSNVEIVTIAETKLDSSFPSVQFIVDGYSAPCWKDRMQTMVDC